MSGLASGGREREPLGLARSAGQQNEPVETASGSAYAWSAEFTEEAFTTKTQWHKGGPVRTDLLSGSTFVSLCLCGKSSEIGFSLLHLVVPLWPNSGVLFSIPNPIFLTADYTDNADARSDQFHHKDTMTQRMNRSAVSGFSLQPFSVFFRPIRVIPACRRPCAGRRAIRGQIPTSAFFALSVVKYLVPPLSCLSRVSW